jgi:hypothetical protein
MTGRERNEKPVDVRVFFLKASEPGIVGFDASSLVLMAISSGELGDGGVLERVVTELLFIDHRRAGIFCCAASGKFSADVGALCLGSGPGAALSVCEAPRLKKLDMVRLKFDVELKVKRLEAVSGLESWSADGVGGVGVFGGAARGVCSGLLGVLGGGVTEVSTTRGGLEPGVVPGRTEGKAVVPLWSAASRSWAASKLPSELERVWKSCDWRPLTGVTGSLRASLSVSSPSSRMGCGRSVGNCRGDDEWLDLLESVVLHDVSTGKDR